MERHQLSSFPAFHFRAARCGIRMTGKMKRLAACEAAESSLVSKWEAREAIKRVPLTKKSNEITHWGELTDRDTIKDVMRVSSKNVQIGFNYDSERGPDFSPTQDDNEGKVEILVENITKCKKSKYKESILPIIESENSCSNSTIEVTHYRRDSSVSCKGLHNSNEKKSKKHKQKSYALGDICEDAIDDSIEKYENMKNGSTSGCEDSHKSERRNARESITTEIIQELGTVKRRKKIKYVE